MSDWTTDPYFLEMTGRSRGAKKTRASRGGARGGARGASRAAAGAAASASAVVDKPATASMSAVEEVSLSYPLQGFVPPKRTGLLGSVSWWASANAVEP